MLIVHRNDYTDEEVMISGALRIMINERITVDAQNMIVILLLVLGVFYSLLDRIVFCKKD